MLYTGSEQADRMADPARGAHEGERRFARRIDCDSSPRRDDLRGASRGGSVRETDAWEHPRRGYGR